MSHQQWGPKGLKSCFQLILPCSQRVTPGCAHKPPGRGDNSFPDSFLSKDRLSWPFWSVIPHPRTGWLWGAAPPHCSLPRGVCVPTIPWPHAGICSMAVQGTGERWVHGSQVLFWHCLLPGRVLAVTAELVMLQSIYTTSSSKKLLQKQPGGSNTLSGECSHLTKKEPFSGEFPNINTWQPLRPPQILLCQFPAKRSAAPSQLPHTKLYSQWVCCRWWLGHKGEVSGNHLALGLQKEQQKL